MKIVHPVFSRSAWLSVIASAVLLLSSSAFAAATEGKEFKKIAPQATEAPDGKIEVIEFFSYGCGHCATLNPHVEAWKKKLPADVVFYKIPVSWGRAQWSAMARAYYALDAIGEESRLSGDVFNALQNERINLTDKKIFLDWAEKKGADRKKLEEMYDSFAVNSKVMQSDKKVENYKVSSVPRFYVNGRYEINTEAVASVSQVLAVVDEVIELVRKDAKKK
ncbi:MAG: thiol:disulfide interchange protein DsbA/DsbL [Proteobacteria bacterium]|nr:thiol:disulfide interchange protein DsbA/DsbL [Pseudomonadota bacterium]MCL2308643.1 thiol:disulfide interchange protein DsbA/DsbL [Pseudomonadota bacterium]